MKKIILGTLMAFPILSLAQRGTFTVKGKVGHLNAPAKAYLIYESADGQLIRDSAVLKNGAFQFRGRLSDPIEARIILDHFGVGINKLRLPVDWLFFSLDKATIVLTAKDSIKKAVVTGSKISEDYDRHGKFVAAPREQVDNLDHTMMNLTPDQQKDSLVTGPLIAKKLQALKEVNLLDGKFISGNPDSYVSLWSLEQMLTLLDQGDDLSPMVMQIDSLSDLYNGLDSALRTNKKGLEIGSRINAIKATTPGATAPLFTQNDPNGNPISLTDFRGKYVLLDFWASWCGPCRWQSPRVAKVYNRFKDRNFTVLSVSLDRPGDKDKWIQAIETDNLSWPQVSDLQFWENKVAKLYGVMGIPKNFLIDPQGKIIARNLPGDELEKKLGEILGN